MITYQHFLPSDEELIAIRKELYRSDGPGCFVLKNFLNEQFVNHLRHFWNKEAPISKAHKSVEITDKSKIFYNGCPNYFYKTPYGHAYYNYFWNAPIDEATHAISFVINQLRNIIESGKIYHDFFALTGNSCSYRVVFTLNGGKIVAPHTDWTSKEYFNPAKLQGTLVLSKKGVDYEGTGMKMESNDKKTTYVFDGNLELNPGDLVFWRYNNTHSVEDVKTSPGQLGFLRMLFPPEFIFQKPQELVLGEIKASDLLRNVNSRILKRLKLKS